MYYMTIGEVKQLDVWLIHSADKEVPGIGITGGQFQCK